MTENSTRYFKAHQYAREKTPGEHAPYLTAEWFAMFVCGCDHVATAFLTGRTDGYIVLAPLDNLWTEFGKLFPVV